MKIVTIAFRWLAFLVALCCAASAGTLLLQNARVYDGSGRAAFRAGRVVPDGPPQRAAVPLECAGFATLRLPGRLR